MKKVWIIISILVIVLLGVAMSLPEKKVKKKKIEEELLGINYEVEGNEASLSYDNSNPVVAMYVKNYGSIVMELYPSVAPNTVNNFISLVKKGFYDNNSFHRLVNDFVLQGGDPDGTGAGGPGYSIRGEFSNNNFDNDLVHDQWVVSMARSNDPNSAGSQFFICLNKASHLDGNYASFGKVIDGFDAITRIEENENVVDLSSGKLANNLIIKKTLIDLKGKEYPEPEIIRQ